MKNEQQQHWKLKRKKISEKKQLEQFFVQQTNKQNKEKNLEEFSS